MAAAVVVPRTIPRRELVLFARLWLQQHASSSACSWLNPKSPWFRIRTLAQPPIPIHINRANGGNNSSHLRSRIARPQLNRSRPAVFLFNTSATKYSSPKCRGKCPRALTCGMELWRTTWRPLLIQAQGYQLHAVSLHCTNAL